MKTESVSTSIILGKRSYLLTTRLSNLAMQYDLMLFQDDVPFHYIMLPYDCCVFFREGSSVIEINGEERLATAGQAVMVPHHSTIKVTTVGAHAAICILVMEPQSTLSQTYWLSREGAKTSTNSPIKRQLIDVEQCARVEWSSLPPGYKEPKHYFRQGNHYLHCHEASKILLNHDLVADDLLLPPKTRLEIQNTALEPLDVMTITFPIHQRDRVFVLTQQRR